MQINIEIPDYNPESGLKYKWENGFEIKAVINNGVVIITANKEGLISLANHFLNLAQDKRLALVKLEKYLKANYLL